MNIEQLGTPRVASKRSCVQTVRQAAAERLLRPPVWPAWLDPNPALSEIGDRRWMVWECGLYGQEIAATCPIETILRLDRLTNGHARSAVYRFHRAIRRLTETNGDHGGVYGLAFSPHQLISDATDRRVRQYAMTWAEDEIGGELLENDLWLNADLTSRGLVVVNYLRELLGLSPVNFLHAV